jgi:hypothetical protein
VDAQQAHDLVHRDALEAWPHVVALIESGRDDLMAGMLLEDVVYSDQLPALIDAIEMQAKRSVRFRRCLLTSGPALGGKGGPEMDRIFKLIDEAEAELATVVEFDEESELRSVWNTIRPLLTRKIVIFKRRQRSGD